MSEVSEEIVAEAKQGGWVPLEEFRDSEDRWVDAETFVKRGREINPILRKHNKELQKQLESANANAKEAIEAAKEFKEFQKKQFEKEKSILEAQIKSLKESKKQAVTDGDGDRVVAIEDAIDTLTQEKADLAPPKETKQTEVPKIDPTLQSWLDKNDWYGTDKKKTRQVNALGEGLKEENPSLQGQAFLDALDDEIESVFKTKRDKPQSGVEGGSTTSRPNKSGKKTYMDLPPDAKAACDRYVKQGLFKTKEEYLAEYDWSE